MLSDDLLAMASMRDRSLDPRRRGAGPPSGEGMTPWTSMAVVVAAVDRSRREQVSPRR